MESDGIDLWTSHFETGEVTFGLLMFDYTAAILITYYVTFSLLIFPIESVAT